MLACENDAYPALDMAGMQTGTCYSAFVRVIPVRCLGSVNTIWITDALNAGYDGVMMMGCKHGDDYQCHFVKGSELASVPHEQDRRHAEAALRSRPSAWSASRWRSPTSRACRS